MSDTATTPQAPAAPPPSKDGAAVDAAIDSKVSDEAWLSKFDPAETDTPLTTAEAQAPEVAAEPVNQEQPTDDTPSDAPKDDGGDALTGSAYEAALSALRRDNIPKSVLEKLTPAEVIQFGSHRAKNQTDVDQAYSDLKTLKTKQTEPSKTQAAPTPTAQVDLKALVQPVLEKLGLEEGDSPTVEAFAKSLLEIAGKENETARQAVDDLRRGQLVMQVERAREKLTERFPGLQDDAKAMEWLKKADGFDESIPLRDRLEDAAKVLFFDDIKQASAKARAEGVRQKLEGQPTTQSRTTPPRALSRDEQDNWALEQLEKGTSMATVRKALTG